MPREQRQAFHAAMMALAGLVARMENTHCVDNAEQCRHANMVRQAKQLMAEAYDVATREG